MHLSPDNKGVKAPLKTTPEISSTAVLSPTQKPPLSQAPNHEQASDIFDRLYWQGMQMKFMKQNKSVSCFIRSCTNLIVTRLTI